MPKYTKPVECCKLTAQLSLPLVRSRASPQGWNLKRPAGKNAPWANSKSLCLAQPNFQNIRAAAIKNNSRLKAGCLDETVGRRMMHSGLAGESEPKSDSELQHSPQASTESYRTCRADKITFAPVNEAEEQQSDHRYIRKLKTAKRGRPREKEFSSKNEAVRQHILSTFKVRNSPTGKEYVSSTNVPKRVKAAIDRAQRSLKAQGRVLSRESFNFEIHLRASSMYPYKGVPGWWVTSYEELFMAKFDRHEHTWQMPARTENFTYELLDTIKQENMENFKAVWEELDDRTKAAQWPLLALWLLRESPGKFSDFLVATNSAPYPPFAMVSDCMVYIRNFHIEETHTESYRSALLTCMGPDRWPVVLLPQRGVRLYAMLAGPENARFAFETLRSRDSQVSISTLLCFMNIFTQASDVDRAIECLRMIHARDSDSTLLSSDRVARHCNMLLQLDSVVEENGVRNFRILPQLLELGVKPNREMMNVVLSNAFATGDSHLGLDMLKYMKDQNMELDSYTYLTLLNDAVARADRGRVETLLQEIYSHEELRNNKYIASKIFHAHFIFGAKNINTRTNLSRMFLDMLELYSRHYDPTPLKDLRIIPQHYNNVDVERHCEPSSHVLFILLATYLRCNPDPARTMRLYRRFRELVAEKHPVICPMVQYPQVFNEFIRPFRHRDADLRACVSIVEDMLQPVSEPITVAGSQITPAKPNVWTWNTLMSVFNAKKQPNAVEIIRGMMEKHGIQYDRVTWNTIIYGSVKEQDMTSTAMAIKNMESQGFTANSYTLRALRYAQDPEQLQSAFEELNQETQQLLNLENETLEQENEDLLDKGLQRLAIAGKKEQT